MLGGEDTPSSEGLTIAQKLFFIGLIVAVCVAFVKTRRRQQDTASFREKTMA